MRQIKTTNIKITDFPMATAKKDTGDVSKKDFMEQLASFIEKEKKSETKSTDTKQVPTEDSLEVEESEDVDEEFDAALTVSLMDLDHLVKQPVEIKVEANFSGKVIELESDETSVDAENIEISSEDQIQGTMEVPEMKTEEVVFKLNNQFNENMTLVSDEISKGTSEVIESLDDSQVSNLLQEIETQLSENPELEVRDVIEGLLSENEAELDKTLKKINLEAIENNSQVETEVISTGEEVNIPENHDINLSEEIEIEGVQDEEVEKELPPEQVKGTIPSADKELGIESEVETQSVELSTVETFEPVNRMDFATETRTPIQSVAQEDFISNIETLMIEETESLDGGDKVTTARIQLTPEHLGKVDLQIEMNGKELSAKIFIEQKETKEWIEQQVAHLKEKLLTQDITLKDFQVIVHEENLNDAFMNSEDNPFFKQKEKDSQARKEQRILKNKGTEVPVQREERSYSTSSGISILV